jgi:hypothetical protein
MRRCALLFACLSLSAGCPAMSSSPATDETTPAETSTAEAPAADCAAGIAAAEAALAGLTAAEAPSLDGPHSCDENAAFGTAVIFAQQGAQVTVKTMHEGESVELVGAHDGKRLIAISADKKYAIDVTFATDASPMQLTSDFAGTIARNDGAACEPIELRCK